MKTAIQKKPTKHILTFGYGNRTSYDSLVEYLHKHDINCIVDVRLSPKAWTRKWWADQVKLFCQSQEVEYISEPRLGNTSGNRNWIPPDAKDAERALQRISEMLKDKNVLLLCAELDPSRCHRKEVAESLNKMTHKPVNHLV